MSRYVRYLNTDTGEYGPRIRKHWLMFHCPKCKARPGFECRHMGKGMGHKRVGAHDERLAKCR